MAIKSLETLDHSVDRALDTTKVVLDGTFHLVSMGTDSIIDARVEQALVRYKANEDVIVNSGIDPDVARGIRSRILAQ
jgi:hypothetical protein|tara:strand:+ start:96 stop:329 length:234 start_codon:yes stop_codon:yes gene_type:complete